MQNDRYKILALDGGGSWALLQVRTLIEIFGDQAKGHDVLRHFDLVASNSGGSIVLGGLVCNMRLSKILGLFESEDARHEIFVPISVFMRIPWLGPRYKAASKLIGLQKHLQMANRQMDTFNHDPMNAGLPHMVIVGFDYDRERAKFFRTNKDSPAASHPHSQSEVTFVEAIHASTNAPVRFFDDPALVRGRRYWDGAMSGNNNPTMLAVVEALAFGVSRENIRILSIGTGSVFLPESGPNTARDLVLEKQGTLPHIEALKAATVIVDDPPDMATFIAHVSLGGRLPQFGETVVDGPVVRMNPLVQPVRINQKWDLPQGLNLTQFRALKNLEMDAVKTEDINLINALFQSWKNDHAPNQAIRANKNLDAEIGHSTFSSALQEARSWLGPDDSA